MLEILSLCIVDIGPLLLHHLFFPDYFWESSRCAYLITEQQYDVFSNTGNVKHHYVWFLWLIGIGLQLLNLMWVVIIWYGVYHLLKIIWLLSKIRNLFPTTFQFFLF